jgi:hypothetical protein
MGGKEKDLQRLGRYIAAARRGQFATVVAAIKEAGVNTETWNRAERGDPIRDDRMTAIERALGWDIGDAERIAKGGEPYSGGQQIASGIARFSDDELLSELGRRLKGIEGRGRVATSR